MLAKEQYIKRHDTAYSQLPFDICKDIVVKLDNRWLYDHVQKSVETSNEGKVTISCNQKVQTDRTVRNNKLNAISRDYKKGTCMLTDVVIPGDWNVFKEEAGKILKYEDLVIEIQRGRCLSDILGKREIKELPKKKKATLCTAHLLQEVLM